MSGEYGFVARPGFKFRFCLLLAVDLRQELNLPEPQVFHLRNGANNPHLLWDSGHTELAIH